MRECERFAQVAQDIWATVSESLWSLMTNERMWAIRSGHSGQMSELIGFLSKSITFIFRSQKISDWLKKILKKIVFLYVFYSILKKAKDLLIPSERSERIAQVAQDKWAIVSKLLRSLTKKWANERITHFLSKLLICSLFWQKTSDSLQNSMSEFPTLWIWGSWKFVYITHTIKKLLGKEKKKF